MIWDHRNIKIKTFGTAVVATLVLVVSIVITASVISVQQTKKIDVMWEQFDRVPARKSVILSHLRGALGYNGMIHHFKNFILRKERARAAKTNQLMLEISIALTAYESLGLNDKEKAALETLIHTLEKYRAGIALAERLVNEGLTPIEVDKQLRINDVPAFEAMKVLEAELFTARQNSSLSVHQAVEKMTVFISIAPLITGGLLVLLTIATVWFVRWRLVRPLNNLVKALETIDPKSPSGKRLPYVEGVEGDELNLVARTANNFLGASETHFLNLHNAEEQLKSSEEHLRTVVETAVDAIITIDEKGIVQSFNAAASNIFNYSNDEVIGKNVSLLMPEPHKTKHNGYLQAYTRTGTGKTLGQGREVEGRRKSGATFPMTLAISETISGGTIGFTGIIRDISAEKEAELNILHAKEALEESKKRYELVMDGVKDAVWDWNIDENILFTSPRFLELLGYEENEVSISSEGWVHRIHPAHQEKYRSLLTAHLKGETPFYSCEYRVSNKDGEYIWVLDRGKALHDESGRVHRMAGSVTDITKRRMSEDGLRRSQKLAAVGELSSGIAHEFNNILVGIRGFTDMAIMDADNPDEVRSCLEEVQKASDRATKLTKDLLAFSRGQEAEVIIVEFDLGEVMSETEAFLKPMLPATVHLHTDVPEQEICIEGDPRHISQVLLNLSINARDAMPDGGDLTIGIRAVELQESQIFNHPSVLPGSYAQMFIRDTGTGIDEKTMGRLFEPFFTTKELGKGTGLGLSVVHGFVEQMGGFIDVESTLGEGSTIYVNLPLAK